MRSSKSMTSEILPCVASVPIASLYLNAPALSWNDLRKFTKRSR